MASAPALRIARLILLSAATQALRRFGRAWGVDDVADAIPSALHPRGEHCAASWGLKFILALEDLAKITHCSGLAKIKEKLQAAVDIWCNEHPKRQMSLIVKDLVNTARVLRK
ncbi:hypothetical protein CC86DRAFT_42087 [Ophiobolus disseminans]|uniref:Uncharacterized protein n=1 Tax=Ophiobolus disseminans TaxID=1469910 RepID=A0A6A6ZWB9_9PLEO|nr:hypothetical protein CC86DRAFT_42087 [Ophiobolus disseminans]